MQIRKPKCTIVHEDFRTEHNAEITLLGPLCQVMPVDRITTQKNEKLLTINKLSITLLEIGAKKSIANDRQIFPLFPDLIDIVTHLIVIYLFHFLHFPTSNIVVYGYKSTK